MDPGVVNTNGLLGGWAAVNGSDWALNNGGTLQPFASYTNQNDPTLWTSSDHVNYNGSGQTLPASATINSLRLDVPNSGSTHLSIGSGATLTLATGGLLIPSQAGATIIDGDGSLTSGTTELYIHQYSTSPMTLANRHRQWDILIRLDAKNWQR